MRLGRRQGLTFVPSPITKTLAHPLAEGPPCPRLPAGLLPWGGAGT